MDAQVTFAQVEARSSIDYMLRTVQQNFVQLTQLADQKANILIGIGIIIVTLTLNVGMSGAPHPALLVLLGFITGSIVFALLALIPRLCSKQLRDYPESGNPLYFGAFASMTLEDYSRHMEQVLTSDAEVYRAIVRDIFLLGAVLNRKYRHLRTSYLLFIAGIVAALLAFVVTLYLPLT